MLACKREKGGGERERDGHSIFFGFGVEYSDDVKEGRALVAYPRYVLKLLSNPSRKKREDKYNNSNHQVDDHTLLVCASRNHLETMDQPSISKKIYKFTSPLQSGPPPSDPHRTSNRAYLYY